MSIKKSIAIFVLILVLASPSFAALADLSAAYVSKYIWRGYDLNAAQPAIQPSATIYLGNTGLTLGLWSSANAGDAYLNAATGNTVNKEATEMDYTLTYASSFNDNWSYLVYYSLYNYPVAPGGNTGEIFFSLTGNALPLTPTLIASYDNDKGKGAYFILAGKKSFSAAALNIDSSLTVGYDCGQFGVKAGLSDATLSISSVIPACNLNITPSVNYTIINKDSRPADENVFWFSLNAGGSL